MGRVISIKRLKVVRMRRNFLLLLIFELLAVGLFLRCNEGKSNHAYWSKTYDQGYIHSMDQTSDDGCILAGKIGVEIESHPIYGVKYVDDILVIKLSAYGDIQWQKRYGQYRTEEYSEVASCIRQTSDGGYILAGEGSDGPLIMKLTRDGEKQWSKTYASSEGLYLKSIQQTSDGGYIVTGFRGISLDYSDIWVFKLAQHG